MVVFLFFLLLSTIIVVTQSSTASSSLQSFFQRVFSFPRDFVVSLMPEQVSNSEIDSLRSENKALLSKKYDFEKLSSELESLRNQFRDSEDIASSLIPARVLGKIGDGRKPDVLIVDIPSGVAEGDTALLGNNLVGVVGMVGGSQARIITVNNPEFEAVVTTSDTGASGIVRGSGGSVALGEVAAQESLRRGDLVVTTGEAREDVLIPQDYVVGRISSVNDAPQAAFKTAEVESLIDFGNLSQVFLYTK